MELLYSCINILIPMIGIALLISALIFIVLFTIAMTKDCLGL